MKASLSISRVAGRKKTGCAARFLAACAAFLAVLLIGVLVLTLLTANRLMRQEPRPLDAFSSNIMPDFSLASFTSLDGQTELAGWYFPADDPVSTIVIVHDQGKNRLQFGLDSAYLYQDLIDQGFCVLAFDLRNSGQSAGRMSAFGYSEWADVLAAIRYVRQHAPTRDVILFGFGSGVSAALLAVDQLPLPGQANESQDEATARLAAYPEKIRELGFDQSYIRGLLLDTPCESADEYIRAICRNEGWLGQNLLQYTVPYAIHLSSGTGRSNNLAALLSRQQLPVFIAYSEADDHVGKAAILPLVEERLRLHPETTRLFVGRLPGYVAGFVNERSEYLASLHDFFQRYISRIPQ